MAAHHQNAEYAASQRLAAWDILDRAHQEISALAASVGIDWAKALPMLANRDTKLTKGIELGPAYRGKVALWYSVKTAKSGQQYPLVTFHTVKHSGLTEVFNGWAWLIENGYVGTKPATRAAHHTPPPIRRADPPINLSDWSQQRFDRFHLEFQTLPRAAVAEGGYFERKGFADGDIPQDFDLRAGEDKRGRFVAYALRGRYTGEVFGYQKIYDTAFTDRNGLTRDKDFVFRPDTKNGSFAWIGTPDESGDICICEGLATGLSVHKATGKAVAVALDAGNLAHVVALLSASFTITVCADNDISKDGGNVGIFSAIQAAWKAQRAGHSASIAVPEIDGQKCDFDDLRRHLGIDAVRGQLADNRLDMPTRVVDYLLLRVKYSPGPQLKKAIGSVIFNASKTIVRRCELPALAERLKAEINGRDASIDVLARLEREFKERILKARPTHSIVDYSDTVQHHIADNREIAELMLETGGVFFDTRGMGAGKTETMRLIQEWAARHDAPVTYTCHRVSLTRSASNRLGLRCYEDVFPHHGESPQGLAVCVNSIKKHGVASRSRGGILLIDEARQTLEHVYHGTVDNRIGVYDELVAAIQNASLIVFADADMNQATLDWVKSIRGDIPHIIMPQPGENGKTIAPVADFATALDMAGNDLRQGRNVWISSDSVNKAKESGVYFGDDEITAWLTNYGVQPDDILVIHAENKGDERQAAFLKDPDGESQKYRVIIHSPVISSGISITNAHFSKTYLISSGVLPANELLQSVARVRRVTDVYAVFKRNINQRRETDYKKLFGGEGQSRAKYCSDTGSLVFTDFDNARIKSLAARNNSLNDSEFEFYMLAEMRGYTIGEAIGPKFSPFEKGRGIGKIVKEIKIDSVLKSETISDTEAKRLDAMSALTQEQTDKLDLHKILKTTGKTKETLTEEMTGFCLFKGGFEKIANHRLLTAPEATLKDQDKKNLEYRNKLGGKTGKAAHFKAIAGVLMGKEFDWRAARAVCEHLAEHSGELAVCGLGSYGTGAVKDHVKRLGKFAERFGYLIEQMRQDHKGRRWYKLAVHPLVAEAVQGGGATL